MGIARRPANTPRLARKLGHRLCTCAALGFAQVELWENPMRRTWSPRLGVFGLCLVWSASAHADPMTLGWAQPGGPGSPVTITYSYSNLFDGGFNTSLATAELRRSTEE